MSHCRTFDPYGVLLPFPKSINEGEKILQKINISFEKMLFFLEKFRNGEIKKEKYGEFAKKIQKDEKEILNALEILVRNPRCTVDYKKYSTVFKKIYDHKNDFPRLFYDCEFFLLKFIYDPSQRFEKYFSDQINREKFLNNFSTSVIESALKDFRYSDF